MKKQYALILACVFMLLLMPAVAEDLPISGNWYARVSGLPAQLTLGDDGYYTFELPGKETETGTWELRDGYIYLDDAELPDLYTLGEDRLCLGDGLVFFTRVKPQEYAPGEVSTDADLLDYEGYWKTVFVDVNGTVEYAQTVNDTTDLYVEGTHAILGGPAFEDVLVAMAFENGALACESAAGSVRLQFQEDGYLRMTVTSDDGTASVRYLRSMYSPALDELSE